MGLSTLGGEVQPEMLNKILGGLCCKFHNPFWRSCDALLQLRRKTDMQIIVVHQTCILMKTQTILSGHHSLHLMIKIDLASSCEENIHSVRLKCFRAAAFLAGWPLPTGHARGSERRRGKPDQSWQPARCGFKMTTPTPLISLGRG